MEHIEDLEESEVEVVEPIDGDYIIYPTGGLGSLYGVSVINEGQIGVFEEWEEAIHFIKMKMKKDKWNSDVYYCDDHGGLELVTLNY